MAPSAVLESWNGFPRQQRVRIVCVRMPGRSTAETREVADEQLLMSLGGESRCAAVRCVRLGESAPWSAR